MAIEFINERSLKELQEINLKLNELKEEGNYEWKIKK